jgi:hypothetical protein
MANDKRFKVKNGLTADNILYLDSSGNEITSAIENDSISWEGDSGQLFSITDDLTGTIFSVNDISGIPSIEVDDDGSIRLAEFSGDVAIGLSTVGTGATLDVGGAIAVNGTIVIESDGSIVGGGGASIDANDTEIIYNEGTTSTGDSTFVYDYTNKRVGIGTATPATALDVAGDISLKTDLLFNSADGTSTITASMSNAGKLGFSGSSGELFSITDDLTGTIFAVNDSSGIPSIEVDDDGTIRLAETAGNVLIGTATDNGSDLLQVDGSVALDYLALTERSSDPPDPAEGRSFLWQSDGTGSGDDGDIMIKITAGGVTKTATLIDFSTI